MSILNEIPAFAGMTASKKGRLKVKSSKCLNVQMSNCQIVQISTLPIHQCLIENILHKRLDNRCRKAFLHGIQILVAGVILIS